MRRFKLALLGAGALFILAAAQVGCEEKPSSSSSPAASASASPADTSLALDPTMRKALAASSSSAAAVSRGDGPPQTGVFEPGGADAVHARGKPAEVKLGSDGSEPRILLAGTPPFKGNATVTVAIRTGPRNALPTVDFGLEFGPEKAPDAKAADAGAEGPVATIIKIKKVTLSSEQLGQVPEAAAKELAKLKGTQLRMLRGPNGLTSDLTLELAKDAAPDLERLIATLADAVLAFEVAAPDKPVGVGAVWIAQTRNAYSGIDVLSYRMYKVTELKGDEVTLSVEVKQYAAGPKMTFAGLPPTATLVQFESLGNGEVKLRKGDAFARSGRFAQQVGIGMPGEGPSAGRVMMLQLQSNVLLTR